MEEPFPEEQDEEEDEEWPRGGRVIVHIDLDCFYAQVEMLRNPQLRSKPLGTQQKNIVVTCNYEARKFGIGKLMSVKEAKEKCPELILVNGEDLTPYREMSYKVTELLGEFCPLVERLGFDENFLDITELVEKKFQELEPNSQIPIFGHVYKEEAVNFQDPVHIRLALGSGIAWELRDRLRSQLGITGCAGIASNKSLAKMISGVFKPDQQTLLLPENHREFLSSLDHIQKIPGIGSKTTERLEKLGVRKIQDLQEFPVFLLEKEFGISAAQRIHELSLGQENSQIIPWKPPQSFSDEDSFPKISTEEEVREKIRELLPKLLERISQDGRKPQTLRLGIRKFPGKNSRREFRQCPIPKHLIPKFGQENEELLPILEEILMKLFRKMIGGKFQLTLLSLGFSKLQEFPGNLGKGSIKFYLKRESQNKEMDTPRAPKIQKIPENSDKKPGILDFPRNFPAKKEEKVPPDVDPEVFSELPPEIQEELWTQWRNRDWERRNSLEKSSGKAPNLGMRSQCDLLRYWKSQGNFSG
ncbi:DNA polymerase iota isoform X2 [Prinia subflava]|uniref:DNA polymerase iota isoform X2 n=1 Tax=Prinia subflava TaxID=208062 RepID=UPI002FE1CF63